MERAPDLCQDSMRSRIRTAGVCALQEWSCRNCSEACGGGIKIQRVHPSDVLRLNEVLGGTTEVPACPVPAGYSISLMWLEEMVMRR
jgi:hypothetical protein